MPKPSNARIKIRNGSFVPYIFTREEITNIFKSADNEKYSSAAFRRCAPLLFRILYGTGLRINEALSLKVCDVVMQSNVLLIRESKNDNSRLVPMSPSLSKRVIEYLSINGYGLSEPLFQYNTGTQLTSRSAYEWFRLILWRAGIPHRGRGKGPRMHDLRHTFAVHSLQNAVALGTDPNAYLPLLSTYLGHRTLSATERYLRLTNEVFPTIIQEMDLIMNSIIPEVRAYE